jgi:hypothetical protein
MRKHAHIVITLLGVALAVAMLTPGPAASGVDPRIGSGGGGPGLTNTPVPPSAIVGATLNDSATLSGSGVQEWTLEMSATLSGGANPTGAITFWLFGPGDSTCPIPIDTESVSVTGNGTYSADVTLTQQGNYIWTAEYSGDANNPELFIGCTDDSSSTSAGGVTMSLTDSVTARTVLDNATGTITFSLYGSDQPGCGSPVLAETADVSGNGTYITPQGFATNTVGTYHWMAHYSGDPNNVPATSDCVAVPVTYEPAGTLCRGAPGHTILPPISSDGTSAFKRGSTVSAKFRVCDANGNSIGTPGVVSSFTLVGESDAPGVVLNEPVQGKGKGPSASFRWDPKAQQWIFNIDTKKLARGVKYSYQVVLNDGTDILFAFALR